MRDVLLFKWFRNISIARKLYFTVGIMALLIGLELFTLFFSINTLSSVRAYVEGEGLWSKAEKDAVYQLLKYGNTHDEQDYIRFKEFMKVPIGDSKARRELAKPMPDHQIARDGFIAGRNHPEDVDGMITLFRRFYVISYINKAIRVWGEAEPIVLELIPIGEKMHHEINSGNPSQAAINESFAQIEQINTRLTPLEDAFSYTLGEGSRWLENLILKLLFGIALTVEITGLLLAISVNRGIQTSLSEIIKAAKAFANGKLSARAKVFSKDEIGQLAHSFNHMSARLEENIRKLESAQKEFSQLLEAAPDAMIIADRDGRIKLVNAQTEKLFGYKREQLLGQPAERLIPGWFARRTVIRSQPGKKPTRLNRQTSNVQLSAYKKDGAIFPAEVSISPLETEEGLLVSAAVRDITERKNSELSLTRYNRELVVKNKELEQFAYVASHDLQEPLRTVTSFAELLQKQNEGRLSPDSVDYMGHIIESAHRMKDQIKSLLDYTRIGRNHQYEQVDCNSLMHDVLDDMYGAIQESGAKITVGPLPTLTGYKVDLKLLFQNLISNAIKFHKPAQTPVINISASQTEKDWRFEINDDGIGIEEEYLQKIFIIFQRLHSRRDYEGSGIGLAHCRKIVELHGGKIWAESTYGLGSSFFFTIPLSV